MADIAYPTAPRCRSSLIATLSCSCYYLRTMPPCLLALSTLASQERHTALPVERPTRQGNTLCWNASRTPPHGHGVFRTRGITMERIKQFCESSFRMPATCSTTLAYWRGPSAMSHVPFCLLVGIFCKFTPSISRNAMVDSSKPPF